MLMVMAPGVLLVATWNSVKVGRNAQREIAEEVGIKVGSIHFGAVTNDIFEKEQKHYVTIIMVCDYVSGDVKVLEPEKSECWEWFSWDKMPEPLFVPVRNLRETGFNPFDINKDN
jgi:8-oxo-dGTP diphosphatase